MALTARKKRFSILIWGGVACAMVGLAFAGVPLYRIFCQVTGYGGTTQTAEAAPATTGSMGTPALS